MNAIKQILVPVDFSPASKNGLLYAMDLARSHGASIILYHSFIPFESGFYPLQKQLKENKAHAKVLADKMNELKEELLSNGSKVSVSICVDRGAEGRQIPKYCKAQNIDLIVMGTTGAGGAKGILTGSFASQVMAGAPCPVLAIPPGAIFKIPKKIIYASDYRETDIGCLRYLLSLNAPFNAKINIVHVVTEEHYAPIEDDLLELHQEKIIKELGDTRFSIDIVEGEEISGALLKYAVDTHSDILAVAHTAEGGLWNRLFRKSITKAALHRTTVPLLAFPAIAARNVTREADQTTVKKRKKISSV